MNQQDKKAIEGQWKQAMKREAISLLLVSKEFVPIEQLKRLSELSKDSVFEEQLFAVSEQQRDSRGQVTFKIKDEFVGCLDPFVYI